MRRRIAVAVIAGAAMLVVPQSAAAKRYTAFAGPSGARPASAPETATLNRFFPARLRVRAGDTVRYRVSFVHTISKLRPGQQDPPDAIPDPGGAVYTPLTDFAGQPFSFNGLPKFINNPDVFTPQGTPRIRTSRFYNSGFVVGGNDVSRELTFPQRGTFRILCLLHPGMEQTVAVSPRRGGRRDTTAQVRRTVRRQMAAGWANVTRANARPVADTTVMAGVGNRDTVIGFVPAVRTVRAGTTVTFEEGSRSEIHNMVFGPRDYVLAFIQANSQIPMGPGTPNQVAPPDIYGSEPAVNGTYTHTGANRGNGFLWTPVMDRLPGDPPQGLPGSVRITFTAPGTFHYICAIHGESMAGDIVVTP